MDGRAPEPTGAQTDVRPDGWVPRWLDRGIHNITIAFLKQCGDNKKNIDLDTRLTRFCHST